MKHTQQKSTSTQNLRTNLNLKLGLVLVLFVGTALSPLFLHMTKASEHRSTSTSATTSTAKTATTSMDQATSTDQATKSQRAQLEKKLEKLEKQITRQQQVIQKTAQKKRTLQNEAQRLQARINKMNLKIEAVDLSLKKLNQDINRTQQKINRTQNKIAEHKKALGEAIKKLYEAENQSFLAIVLQNDKISDFFKEVNQIMMLQDNIQKSLKEVSQLKDRLLQQKQELNLEKQDVKNLKRIRQREKRKLAAAKRQKQQLVQRVESRKSRYEKRLKETQKTASEIRNQIFKLVGGEELNFETAYKYAKLAEGATSVRASLIMAILQQESRLGENVGQCSYKKAMDPQRDIPVFKAILSNLNISPDSPIAKVSCPNQHGTYGGAMGPSQFIPSTWAIYGGYEKENGQWVYKPEEDRIRQVTGGDKPSNPWNNSDAFVATAIYIKDLLNSSGCQNYANKYSHLLSKQKLKERCAAAKYYAGSRWWTYRFWYGDSVLSKAKEIQKDIEVLESS